MGRRAGQLGSRVAQAARHAAQVFLGRQDLPSVQREAWAAIGRIERGALDRELRAIGGLIVDEIQDLTLLQIAVLAKASRRAGELHLEDGHGYGPLFVAAGDESQVVHPSGFDWGSSKDLLAEILDADPPRDHPPPEPAQPGPADRGGEPDLEAVRRPPARVPPARLGPGRHRRCPGRRRRRGGAGDGRPGRSGPQRLAGAAGRHPAQRRRHRRDPLVGAVGRGARRGSRGRRASTTSASRPARSRGWIASTSCSGAPRESSRASATRSRPRKTGASSVRYLVARTGIDELRVALSRSTETLILVDTPDAETDPLLQEIADDGLLKRRSIAFLRARLEERNADARERAVGFLEDTLGLLEADLDRALRTLIRFEAALAGLVDADQRREVLERSIEARRTGGVGAGAPGPLRRRRPPLPAPGRHLPRGRAGGPRRAVRRPGPALRRGPARLRRGREAAAVAAGGLRPGARRPRRRRPPGAAVRAAARLDRGGPRAGDRQQRGRRLAPGERPPAGRPERRRPRRRDGRAAGRHPRRRPPGRRRLGRRPGPAGEPRRTPGRSSLRAATRASAAGPTPPAPTSRPASPRPRWPRTAGPAPSPRRLRSPRRSGSTTGRRCSTPWPPCWTGSIDSGAPT